MVDKFCPLPNKRPQGHGPGVLWLIHVVAISSDHQNL